MTSSVFCSGANLNPSGCMVCVGPVTHQCLSAQLTRLGLQLSTVVLLPSVISVTTMWKSICFALFSNFSIREALLSDCSLPASLHSSSVPFSCLIRLLLLNLWFYISQNFFINFFLILSRQCCLDAIISLQHPYFNLKESRVFFYISSVLSSLLSDAYIDFCFH